jgi:hypothetical protein
MPLQLHLPLKSNKYAKFVLQCASFQTTLYNDTIGVVSPICKLQVIVIDFYTSIKWKLWAPESTTLRCGHLLYVPSILQQIQISVDQPYAGPGSQLLRYQRDI